MICCSSRTLRVSEAVEAFLMPLFVAVVVVVVDVVVDDLSFFFVFSVFLPSSDEVCLDEGISFSFPVAASVSAAAAAV